MHAGLVIKRVDEAPDVPFFHAEGTTFRIGDGNDEIDVFVYPTTAARARDTDALDSVTVSPKGTRHRWQGTPTLVTSNNLAAVIRSERQRQVERLALALGAGLPAAR